MEPWWSSISKTPPLAVSNTLRIVSSPTKRWNILLRLFHHCPARLACRLGTASSSSSYAGARIVVAAITSCDKIATVGGPGCPSYCCPSQPSISKRGILLSMDFPLVVVPFHPIKEAINPLGEGPLTDEPSHNRGLLHRTEKALSRRRDNLEKSQSRSTPDLQLNHRPNLSRRDLL